MSRSIPHQPGLLVHPHMRGDNPNAPGPATTPYGSPPHAWGQFYRSQRSFVSFRFTPTCVGTISLLRSGFLEIPVHPHMRGDNVVDGTDAYRVEGSPPHAWGQLSRPLTQQVQQRFTPTCVGTINHFGSDCRSLTVHPHMRGDNSFLYSLSL